MCRFGTCSDHVAAGDAHYTYRNVPSFTKHGEMSVHNRKELLAWLDKIIEDTQRSHNFHLVSDDEDMLSGGLVAPGSPVQLPTFITFRYRSHSPHTLYSVIAAYFHLVCRNALLRSCGIREKTILGLFTLLRLVLQWKSPQQ